MENPHALAKARVDVYNPLIVNQKNSEIFGNDMLHFIGCETESYKEMTDYYTTTGNRRAACMSSLLQLKKDARYSYSADWHTSKIVAAYDSLITLYADIDLVAEVAVERCLYICNNSNATRAERVAEILATQKKYGKWQTIGKLTNKYLDLTQPHYDIAINTSTILPTQSPVIILSDIRNIGSITADIYRLDTDGRAAADDYSEDKLDMFDKKGKPVKEATLTHTYKTFEEYDIHDDTLRFAPLPIGIYLVKVTSDAKAESKHTLLYVSNVNCLSQQLPGKKIRYVVVNATTGQPLPNAKLSILTGAPYGKTGKWITRTCNKRGETVYSYDSYKPKEIFPHTPTDRYMKSSSTHYSFNYYDRQHQYVTYGIFTDRSIYRPGQTVKASVVAYRNGEKGAVEKAKNITIALRDAHYKVVKEEEVTTDDFGVASAEFALPTDVLPGHFSISVDNDASLAFRAEEYKRPTFRVERPEVKKTYKAGDTLLLQAKAKAFGGFPVQDADVAYTVRRTTALWWRSYLYNGGSSSSTIVYEGEATTDEEGMFEIEVPLTMPHTDNWYSVFYNFTVEASVTDIAGETRYGTMTVPLGTKDAYLTSDIKDKMLADSTKSIRFTVRNASGNEVSSTVRFRFDNEQDWRTASTEKPYMLTERLSSGKHSIMAIAEDDTLKQEFIMFSLDDKRPCTPTQEWFYTSEDVFRTDGKPVTIQVGSSDKDVHVVYTMTSGNKLLKSGSFLLSDSLHNRKLTYRKEYGDGILLSYAWMKNGHLHTYNTSIRKPLPDTKLRMKWTTFRDRLTPGTNEEWRLSITNPDGTPAKAHLIATLYDKSLDMLVPHQWQLHNNIARSLPNTIWNSMYKSSYNRYVSVYRKEVKFTPLMFAHFYHGMFGGEKFYSQMVVGSTLGKSAKRLGSFKGVKMMAANNDFADTRAMEESAVDAETGSRTNTETAATDNDIRLRENFSETAFFTPSLTTDDKGEVALKFTLPESVTTWRFMGIAHTKNMFTGSIEGEAVATKTVMVQPNIPRFIRTGDKACISTRIVNTSAKQVFGFVNIR